MARQDVYCIRNILENAFDFLILPKYCLLPYTIGPVVVILLIFLGCLLHFYFRLQLRRNSAKTHVKLNCWFCCQDVEVQPDQTEFWKCASCEQFNGFTQDGDYCHPLKEQWEVKDYKTPTICTPSEFSTAKSALCHACSQNQVLNVRQLAAFIPLHQNNYDGEVEEYGRYLEERYALCQECQEKVSCYLMAQDKTLVSKMTSAQLCQLDTLKSSCDKDRSEVILTIQDRNWKSSVPPVLFVLCILAGTTHLLFSLAHVCPLLILPVPGQNATFFQHLITSYTYHTPPWFSNLGQEGSVYAGTIFCMGGLLVSGKNSFLPEDALHLLLWLLMACVSSDVASFSVAWLGLTKETAYFLSAATLAMSFVCCFKNRSPRHYTTPVMLKKQLSQSGQALKTSSPDASSIDDQSSDDDESKTSSVSSISTSSSSTRNDPAPQFNQLQQHLESLSLGLTRRSDSASSIWSMPACVSASVCGNIPDSTTDSKMRPSQRAQGFLTPSRLGNVNFDSAYKGGLSSRSCSSWSSFNCSTGLDTAKTHPGSSFSSYGPSPPLMRSVPGKNFVTNSKNPKSAFRKVEPSKLCSLASGLDIGPCDSQTPDLIYHQLPSFFSGIKLSQGRTGTSPSIAAFSGSSGCPSVSQIANSYTTANSFSQTGPRRSQRLATMGKLPKPWPLKKSFSCNIICQENSVNEARSTASCGNFLALPSKWSADSSMVVGPFNNNSHVPTQLSGVTAGQSPLPGKSIEVTRSSSISLSSKSPPSRRPQKFKQAEFSDDEFDDSCTSRTATSSISTGVKVHDSSWTWLVVGVMLGASVTTNIFLVCHSWWSV